MNTNTQTYKVLINGDEFHLVSDEAEAHVRRAAEKVNEIIQKLSESSSQIDKRKVAVLAALQLSSELLHLQNDLSQREVQEAALVSVIDRVLASL